MYSADGRKRGKRAGKRGNTRKQAWAADARKTADREVVPHIAESARWVGDAGIYHECLDTIGYQDEHGNLIEEKHLIDQSVTAKQFLRFFGGRPAEVIDLAGKRLDHQTGKAIRVTESKVLSRTDSTLLRRVKPDAAMPRLKRTMSRSKRTVWDQDVVFPYSQPQSKEALITDDQIEAEPKGRRNVSSKGVKLGSTSPESSK